MPGPTDTALLARAAAGDDAAFAALVGPHQRAVFRHCNRMLGSGAFGAWLQRIATNICLDGLRAKRTRIGPASYGPPMAVGMMPEPPDPELAWVEPVSDSDLNGTGDPQDE